MENTYFALLLTVIAGGSTVIGAVIGILNKKPSRRFISFIMALSAGVMMNMAFTEMFGKAIDVISMAPSLFMLSLGLGAGILIDMILPSAEKEHTVYNGINNKNKSHIVTKEFNINEENSSKTSNNLSVKNQEVDNKRIHRKRFRKHNQNDKIMRMGMLTLVALFLHNLPEGLATFSAGLIDPDFGIQLAIATALHNIPEGISVAVPVYAGSGSKSKALGYSAISGLAEPIGAVLAWLVLSPILNDVNLMYMLAFTAGIMIYVSIDVLIPTAKNLGEKHDSVIGFTLGMIIMGLTLIFI